MGCGCELFSFVVDCRSLVGGTFVALALLLRAVERCDNARRVGAAVMVWRISFVRRPWRLGCWVQRPRGAPLTPRIFVITVVSNSDELVLVNYQLQ